MKTKKLLFTMVMACLAMTGFGQTWNIGYPNEADVKATLSNGTMTISGTGKMNTFMDSSPPWESVKEQIQSVVIEDGVTAIGEFAFFEHTSLTDLSIGNTVEFIGQAAFFGCSISFVSIPDGVEEIAVKAFAHGTVTSLVIPASVTGIFSWAFAGNSNLSEISVSWNDPSDVFLCPEDDPFYEIDKGAVTLHVPVGKKAAYAASDNWKDFNIVDDGKIIGDNSVRLANLTVSAGILSPGFNPARLTYRVNVPKSVETITLIATPMEDGTVSGDGTKTLSIGENSFEITVANAEGSSVYTVHVTRLNAEFSLQALSYSEVTTGALVVTYYDYVVKADRTVPVIDRYEVEYELLTGNIAGNLLPLHFDVENGRGTQDFVFNVDANSVYRFTLYVNINYAGQGDISFTTHYNAFGQPSSTTMNYRRHACDVVALANNEVLSAIEINRVGSFTGSISVSDLTFTGTWNRTSIKELSGIPSVSIFPNPVSDFMTIAGLQGNETLYFYNITGQLLFSRKASSETERVAVGHLPAGVYFIKTDISKAIKWIKK